MSCARGAWSRQQVLIWADAEERERLCRSGTPSVPAIRSAGRPPFGPAATSVPARYHVRVAITGYVNV